MTRWTLPRITFLLAASLAFALSLPAADLIVWHAWRGSEKDAFEKVVTNFNAAHASMGVKVVTNAVPYDPFADPILGGFRKQVANAVAMPNVPEMTLVWTPVTNAMNTIVKKSATPEAALKTAQQEVEAAIAAK